MALEPFGCRLCDDIDATNVNDIANLFSNLAGNFENVVQYNRDNRAFEVSALDGAVVILVCSFEIVQICYHIDILL